MNNSIKNLFSTWGKDKRQMPEHNATLKQAMIARASLMSTDAMPKNSRMGQFLGIQWLSFAFAGLAVIALIVVNPQKQVSQILAEDAPARLQATSQSSGRGIASWGMNNASDVKTQLDEMSSHEIQSYSLSPTYGGDLSIGGLPITDSREFLKTNYSVQMKTRDVMKRIQDVKLAIRGLDGRIDGLVSSEKNGSIQFALPANKLDELRATLRSMTHDRLWIEYLSMTNFLLQKQSLEQTKESYDQKIVTIKSERSSLIYHHNQVVASLNARINASTDEQEIQSLRWQLARENTAYANSLAQFNSSLSYTESVLEDLAKQDKAITDTVATVNGNISVQYVSAWDILGTYVGPYWLVIVLAIISAYSFFIRRSKSAY